MEKRVIALDIGNVCLEIHPERCFGALGFRSVSEIPPEALFLASERFERGEVTPAEFLAGFRKLTGTKFSDEELEALSSRIEEAYEDLEIDAHRGEQALYPVVFSLE